MPDVPKHGPRPAPAGEAERLLLGRIAAELGDLSATAEELGAVFAGPGGTPDVARLREPATLQAVQRHDHVSQILANLSAVVDRIALSLKASRPAPSGPPGTGAGAAESLEARLSSLLEPVRLQALKDRLAGHAPATAGDGGDVELF